MKKFKLNKQHYILLAVVVIVIAVGLIILGLSHASPPSGDVTATSGTLSGQPAVAIASNSGATGGQYVKFDIPSTPTGNSLCGFKTGTPTISKLMIVWEENESDSSIVGNSSLPYMNSLISECGFASNYWSYTHPSLPNYMAMTSGVSYASSPWNGDCLPADSGCTTGNNNLFNQLGSNWKGYAESMTKNCEQTNDGATDSAGSQVYAPKHNPEVYYTDISSECANQDVPLGTVNSSNVLVSGNLYNDVEAGTLPELSTVTPNLNDDWHDGTASQADSWLKGVMGVITAGPDYQSGKLAILIVFDEGNGSGNATSNTYATWVSPFVTPGTKATTCFDDNSVTQTVEKLFNLSIINSNPLASNCSTETNMISAFNL